MVTRTKRLTLTFQHPFSLTGVDARDYEVLMDEELIEELLFPVYRRVADDDSATSGRASVVHRIGDCRTRRSCCRP